MTSSHHRMLGACALAALVACHGESSGGSGLIVSNLGLATLSLQQQGDRLCLVLVSEVDQGQGDLNGDGDVDDAVAFVYAFDRESLTNLGLATAVLAPTSSVVSHLVAVSVVEADQGSTDLNADGDTDDAVLFVYDAVSGTTTNTHLAGVRPAIAVGSVAFAVAESAQGEQDLNGDGDTSDLVLHVYDSSTGLSTNAQRSLTGNIGFYSHGFPSHGFACTTDEESAHADLNGDGDSIDTSILELFDLENGGIVEIPLAIRGQPLAVFDGLFPLVDEGQQGLDLNGDGDLQDGVYHGIRSHLPTPESIGISSSALFHSATSGLDLALVAQEIDGVDRNGDGDELDTVLVLYDPSPDRALDSGLAIDTDATFVFIGFPDRLFFAADEAGQGADLNGDGDMEDDVLHRMDRASGEVENLRLDVLGIEGFGMPAFARSESDAGRDWNGDGDRDDLVEFYLDPFDGTQVNTRLACTGSVAAGTFNSLLLVAPESGEGADLNGDRDQDDLVYVLHDLVTRTNRNLGLAAAGTAAVMSPFESGLVLVSEDAQGQDLNEDGDRTDFVLFHFARTGASPDAAPDGGA